MAAPLFSMLLFFKLIGGDGRVLGIDVDIRRQNRKAIVEHPLARERINMIEGSSTDGCDPTSSET